MSEDRKEIKEIHRYLLLLGKWFIDTLHLPLSLLQDDDDLAAFVVYLFLVF